MEVVSLIVSVCAFLFSVVAFMKARRQEKAQFDIERDSTFEGRLADWPKAFALHGINIEAAKTEGVSPEEIAYMILSVNGLAAYCNANGFDVYAQLTNNDYRQRMFAQSETRRVWRYARLCIPGDTVRQIDRYITETHGDEYQPLENC